jgi:hypothetical protein
MGAFKNKGRSCSMISELFMAANQTRIVINYDKKNTVMMIWSKEDKKKIMWEKGQIAKTTRKF